jgi:hypothetical protein
MGGIRPSSEEPIICSFARCSETWIGFFTPDLQETESLVREYLNKHNTCIATVILMIDSNIKLLF